MLATHELSLAAGHLTTLNFNQWNLACDFPADEIRQLEFLENLSMSNNFNLTVRQCRCNACLQHCMAAALAVCRSPLPKPAFYSRVRPGQSLNAGLLPPLLLSCRPICRLPGG